MNFDLKICIIMCSASELEIWFKDYLLLQREERRVIWVSDAMRGASLDTDREDLESGKNFLNLSPRVTTAAAASTTAAAVALSTSTRSIGGRHPPPTVRSSSSVSRPAQQEYSATSNNTGCNPRGSSVSLENTTERESDDVPRWVASVLIFFFWFKIKVYPPTQHAHHARLAKK